MHWQLEGVNVKPSAELASFAEHRVRQSLSRMAGWVRRVTLRVRDTDLSELEAGRHVKAIVQLANGATVVVDQPTRDFYAGISRLSDRLCRHVRQRLNRQRTRTRRKRQQDTF